MKYAVNRTCQMAGCASRGLLLDVPILRETLRKIRPAAHGVSHKTWANIRSLFGRVLELAGVIDRMRMGLALRHPMWGPLMKAVAHDKRLILTPADGKLEIELRGDLAGILAMSEAKQAHTFSPKKKALQIKMVAGTRNRLDSQLRLLTTVAIAYSQRAPNNVHLKG